MAKSATPHFQPALFKFLRELKENNNREWFEANKSRYEADVKERAQQFISDFGPRLAKISPHFNADPRPNRGSMFRIYRDVRFSKDKSPYKTAVGIQFRHKAGKDAHAPGFYLHLQPGALFVGVGIWRPDGPSLKRIRDAIVSDPAGWKRVKRGKPFRSYFELEGDTLKRPPKGYDPEHPLIDDLKRKDFIAGNHITQRQAVSPDFLDEFTTRCRGGAPFVRYLAKAVSVAF
ncbi:MAG: DUF2461 domain-containing protein [Acidobacteriota bacterium]|nr:DUF2461 domain-containing protein [Acidobacteriota bacterium]